jgi:mono/diheme cytochrome c family protein
MGAYTMRCSRRCLNVLVPVMILAAPAAGLAQSRYNVGTPLSQDEIRSFDFMLGPEGKELPPGHGTAKEGAEVFANRCAVCHGQNGKGGIVRSIINENK